MRVAVGKIEGVRDVKVSLNEGLATIQFATSNHVSIEKVRAAIRSNGFTPRGAEVRVAGSLVNRADTLFLTVSESADAFILRDAPEFPDQLRVLRNVRFAERVILDGSVPETPKGARRDSRPVLLVRSFKAE